jgi:hypothetical protein
MARPSSIIDLRTPPPPPAAAGKEARPRAVRPHPPQQDLKPVRRRFGRTIGFWLGAAVLGTAGCVFGGLMPYRHPVAVTVSVLWWGTYIGTLGAGIGALLGLCAEKTAARPSRGSPGAGNPYSGADGPGHNWTATSRPWSN